MAGRKIIDLTGHTYGPLVVLAYVGRRRSATYWTCKCLVCGRVKECRTSNLRRLHSTECRCSGFRKWAQPGYHAWSRIITTGKVCKRWQSYERFIADMCNPPKGKPFLKRIDPTRPYKPGNCEWAAAARARLLKYKGRTMSLSDWAREAGLSRQVLHHRLERMPLDEALRMPVRRSSSTAE